MLKFWKKIKGKSEEDFKEEDRIFQENRRKKSLALFSENREDKYEEALNAIIWHFKHRNDKSIEDLVMHYHDFLFEDTVEENKLLSDYLEKLKQAGCFYEFYFADSGGNFGIEIHFEDVSIERLKEIRVTKKALIVNKVTYAYNPQTESGSLIIGDIEIIFKKLRAKILDFFSLEEDNNEPKNYKDFNAFSDESVTSDEFSKEILAINKRIQKESSAMISDVIIKKENKKTDANIYTWFK